MNVFVYSDESGVFDKEHNDIFVFAGLMFFSREERDIAARKYIAAENVVRKSQAFSADEEIKASVICNANKGKLFRSLNAYHKFAVIIHQPKILDNIFSGKKDKQRYLDFAYKIGVKHKFVDLISKGTIISSAIDSLYFYVDEHTTATNGRYELRESLEQEFKYGTYNWNYSHHFKPIFSKLNRVELSFCNSASKTLVRAADIVANKVYYHATSETLDSIRDVNNLFITELP